MLQAAVHQDQKFKKLDRDNYIKNASDELNHIIGKRLYIIAYLLRKFQFFNWIAEVIDEFLLIADANKDGLLHYPEYVKAITEN